MEDTENRRLKLKSIDHIGIVVKDIDEVAQSWSSLFGIASWTYQDMSGTDREGNPWKVRLASACLGPVMLELIQPTQGRIFHSQFLETHGEGLHHIGFSVDDVEKAVSLLVAKGAKRLSGMRGFYAYLENGGPGGVVFELVKRA